MILAWRPDFTGCRFSPVECRFEPVFPRPGLELWASTRNGRVRGKQARITWKKTVARQEAQELQPWVTHDD